MTGIAALLSGLGLLALVVLLVKMWGEEQRREDMEIRAARKLPKST